MQARKMVAGKVLGACILATTLQLSLLVGHAAALSADEIKRWAKSLSFNSVKALVQTRDGLDVTADLASGAVGLGQNAALELNVARELKKIEPKVRSELAKNPKECALVVVDVNSRDAKGVKQYDGPLAQFEGVGDSATQVMAPKVLTVRRYGMITRLLSGGMAPDLEASRVVCYSLKNGELKKNEISMANLRPSLEAAVQELIDKEKEAAKNKAAPPNGKDNAAPASKKQPPAQQSKSSGEAPGRARGEGPSKTTGSQKAEPRQAEPRKADPPKGDTPKAPAQQPKAPEPQPRTNAEPIRAPASNPSTSKEPRGRDGGSSGGGGRSGGGSSGGGSGRGAGSTRGV